jgi:hypothetical protein
MLSSGANFIMVSSGADVIIWCYHVMLSSGMIAHPFFIFLKTSLTRYGASYIASKFNYCASSLINIVTDATHCRACLQLYNFS